MWPGFPVVAEGGRSRIPEHLLHKAVGTRSPGGVETSGHASPEGAVGTRSPSPTWTDRQEPGGTDGALAVAVDTAGPDSRDTTVEGLGPSGVPRQRWRSLRVAGAVVMGLWCIGLVLYSTTIYHHAILGEDFATYNQAWTLIGQGHLNPYDTIYHVPFVKSDFELIIWPLALVHLVYPGSVALLWIQDLAVAASGFVVFLWIVDYLERRTVPWWPAAGVASVVLAVLVVNPGAYQILSFDFHMEPISTPFVLLAGRDLWSGRHRRAWIWVVTALTCGTFAAITMVGLGISALLAGRETRRQGARALGGDGDRRTEHDTDQAPRRTGVDHSRPARAGRSGPGKPRRPVPRMPARDRGVAKGLGRHQGGGGLSAPTGSRSGRTHPAPDRGQ